MFSLHCAADNVKRGSRTSKFIRRFFYNYVAQVQMAIAFRLHSLPLVGKCESHDDNGTFILEFF